MWIGTPICSITKISLEIHVVVDLEIAVGYVDVLIR